MEPLLIRQSIRALDISRPPSKFERELTDVKRTVTITIILISAMVTYYWSVAWGVERMEIGVKAVSPDGDNIAQFYTLPENSVTPYGHGVYLHRRLVPAWVSSRLVFAAYCSPNMQLHWRTPKELVVTFNVIEGEPKVLPPPKGIVVTHASRGS